MTHDHTLHEVVSGKTNQEFGGRSIAGVLSFFQFGREPHKLARVEDSSRLLGEVCCRCREKKEGNKGERKEGEKGKRQEKVGKEGGGGGGGQGKRTKTKKEDES